MRSREDIADMDVRETISAALSLPQEIVRTLLDRSEDVHHSVTAHFGEPLSPEWMGAYFNMGSADAERVTLGGYFTGLQIIHRLVESGLDFKALTEMPGDKIWQVYQALD